MKKALGILLVVLMSLSLLSGCGEKEPEPLRICVDIEYANDVKGGSNTNDVQEAMQFLLVQRLYEVCRQKDIEKPEDITVEYLPAEGVDREIAMDRLRTEIMSGAGPDIFLIYCNEKDPILSEEAIFTMPEKAMELSVFMTLDEYMENKTQFAEWDRMNQTVLAAGRTDEGQQIIPLSYRIPVSVYRAEEAEHTPSKEITWMDMLESDNEALAAAAVWTDNASERYADGIPFMLSRAPMTEFIIGAVADYEEEELLFTEEELGQRLAEIIELADRYTAGEFDSAPAHYNEYLGWEFDDPFVFGAFNENNEAVDFDARNGIKWNDTYTMVPLYSDDGGVTAEISAYAAINRNTRRPEDAFLILDYLSSYTAQRCEHIYQTALYKYNNPRMGFQGNLPMYDELMSRDQRIYWVNGFADSSMMGWYLPDENFAQLCAVRDQITHVRFRNAIDLELTQIYRDYHDAIRFGGAPDEVVATGYRRMQQMLRE